MKYTLNTILQSPERLEGNVSDFQKDDIYALGMILLEVWSRCKPYDNLDVESMISKIVDGARPPLQRQSRTKTVPAPSFLKNLITKCWATSPSDRPDMGDVSGLFMVGLSLPPQNQEDSVVVVPPSRASPNPPPPPLEETQNNDEGGLSNDDKEESEDDVNDEADDEMTAFLREVKLLKYKPVFIDNGIEEIALMCDANEVDDFVLTTLIKLNDLEVERFRRGVERKLLRDKMKSVQQTAQASKEANVSSSTDHSEAEGEGALEAFMSSQNEDDDDDGDDNDNDNDPSDTVVINTRASSSEVAPRFRLSSDSKKTSASDLLEKDLNPKLDLI
jgi:serine/threonine protein kinase